MTDQDLVTLQTSGRPVEFRGRRIAAHSTEGPTSQRWTEMELYRHTDGTGRYELYVIGRSVVYHLLDYSCGPHASPAGTATDAAKVDADLYEPCTRCRPDELEDMAPGATVGMETNRYSVHECADVDAVLGRLRSPDGSLNEFREPARRLLDQARLVDENFSAPRRV